MPIRPLPVLAMVPPVEIILISDMMRSCYVFSVLG
jgi:hypothetical protein